MGTFVIMLFNCKRAPCSMAEFMDALIKKAVSNVHENQSLSYYAKVQIVKSSSDCLHHASCWPSSTLPEEPIAGTKCSTYFATKAMHVEPDEQQTQTMHQTPSQTPFVKLSPARSDVLQHTYKEQCETKH